MPSATSDKRFWLWTVVLAVFFGAATGLAAPDESAWLLGAGTAALVGVVTTTVYLAKGRKPSAPAVPSTPEPESHLVLWNRASNAIYACKLPEAQDVKAILPDFLHTMNAAIEVLGHDHGLVKLMRNDLDNVPLLFQLDADQLPGQLRSTAHNLKTRQDQVQSQLQRAES